MSFRPTLLRFSRTRSRTTTKRRAAFQLCRRSWELADSIVVIRCRPLFNPLCLAFNPLGQASHYNVGQAALLQKAQQLVVEETGIGSHQADLLALLPQREGFFEKLDHSTAGSAVAAAQPAVEHKVSFGQHGEQRMMAGAAVFAWVVSFQRTFLLSITLKHCRVEIETVALVARRQAFQLPALQRLKQTLHVAHGETAKQVANRVVSWKSLEAEHRIQRLVPAQPGGMSEPSGAGQHRNQKTNQRGGRIDLIPGLITHWHVAQKLTTQTDPVQVLNENNHTAKRGHSALSLAQVHPLA